MYTVDLHLKNETVDTACYNLMEHIKLARASKERVLCLIVGYGSTGGTHKIKTAVLERLNELKGKNQVKGFLEGNEVEMFNPKYLSLKDHELIPKRRYNKGEIIVIL
ncbi:MAG: Smr/MutS family protein [Anaeroplasmataceae bacterium]|nr:Smr/MutS family protein [Anaeroplasmataceae bacterium]